MNILITGSNGQLGQELKTYESQFPQFKFLFTDVDELDILDSEAIQSYFSENKISAIINCAAYTAVDKAETDKELCKAINATGALNLANAAKVHKAKFIHVSTDFVFDGTSNKPYVETDPTHPLGVYGATKLEGEDEVSKACPESVILRTSWLYSSFGNNFVKTMIRLGKERNHLGVVFDQVGTPTYANDLAFAILSILDTKDANFVPGLYHYSNEGVASWYDFTKAIHELAHISCNVQPIEASAYPVPAARPHYSVLNKEKIKKTYAIEIPYWRDALKKCLLILDNEK